MQGNLLVPLPGHVPPPLSQATPMAAPSGAVAAATTSPPLTLTVVLNRTDEAGFDAYLADVQDPLSPNHLKFLTQDQLTIRFGPCQEANDRVLGCFQKQGFSLAQGSANRLTLTSALGPTSYLVMSLSGPAGATVSGCSATGGLVCKPLTSNANSVTDHCPGPSICQAGATMTLILTSSAAGAVGESVAITPAGYLAQTFTVNRSPVARFTVATPPERTQSCNGQVIPLSQLCPGPQPPLGPQPLPVVISFPPGLS